MTEEKLTPLQAKLARLNRESEERSAQELAKKLNHPYVDLRKTPISLEALKLIPAEESRSAKAAAIELKVKRVALALADPNLPEAKKVLRSLEDRKYEVKIFIASLSGLEQAQGFYKFISEEAKEITGKVDIEKKNLEELIKQLHTFQEVKSEIEKFDFKTTTTTALLEIVLAGALANKASDIHFEAEEKNTKIRFRLDGLLHDIFNDLPVRNYQNLISRIKLLSGMKINIRGQPQDGRFTIGLVAKEIEVRVSIVPSEFGETTVMRILDPEAISVELPQLGFREDNLKLVEEQLTKPNGLILNTGPTGSGKTTTLYAFLRKLVNPEIKIITIEEPIEYRIPGIEQTQVDPGSNYTFAKGLRAIVRQDPDVILVGEVRDGETADIAMHAALTGHMVLSTLHTNDAVGVVPRLVDLGVKPSIIGPALNLAIAQRLVRKLCEKCKKPAKVTPELETKISKFLEGLPKKVNRDPYRDFKIFEPQGCSACNNLGYKGRIGIFEFLEAGPDFEETILKETSEVALKKLAQSQEMVTMQQDGILKVLSGITSFKEVERGTGFLEW
ncbi:MAG: type II/IV secretion system protein [Candidatus Liptonbacteria bacterium]|nr:type II/IV secretion system protein [Candidatus Liptonbacteria bacterium]